MRLLDRLAGLNATLLMEHASSFLYGRQREETPEREQELRPEMPTTALVRKAAGALGHELEEGQAARLGMAAQYAFAAAGGPAAAVLADRGAGPVRAGLTVAAAMELCADQGANTLLGLTEPTWRFPLVTHARALGPHLVSGLGLGSLLAVSRDR